VGHNLGTWATGEKALFKFDTPESSLLCNVHPEMSGFVVIVTLRRFTRKPDAHRSYKIADCSDGSYSVSAGPKV